MPTVSVQKKVSGLKSLIFPFEASLPLQLINSHSGNFVFRGASKHKSISVYSYSHTLCLQTGGDVYLKSCSLASSLSAWNVSHLQLGDINYLLMNKKRGPLALIPWWCEWRWENSASHVQLLSLLWTAPCWPAQGWEPWRVLCDLSVPCMQCRDPSACMKDIGFIFFKLTVPFLICLHPFFTHPRRDYWQCNSNVVHVLSFKCFAA